MSQTRTGSFIEACLNIAVGFLVSWIANILVLRHYGFQVSAHEAFGIGLIFTGISLARQYVLRRYFNGLKFGHKTA